MLSIKSIFITNILLLLILFILNSCGIYRPVSAKEYPPDPDKRVQKNLEEGRGVTLMGALPGGKKKGGTFDFASSNELWRASLDTIDFMPLASANYSGGIIITDWYSDDETGKESIKLTIRFLTNELRSDAIDIKLYRKDCGVVQSCKTYEETGNLANEIKKSILKKAAIYKKENIKKNKRFYPDAGGDGIKGDMKSIF